MRKTYWLQVDGKEAFKSRACTRAQAERSAKLIKLNNGAVEVIIIEK